MEPRPLALITGASSGIGAAYAEQLAAGGYDLVLAARTGSRLEELALRLGGAYGTSTWPLAVDLATTEGLNEVETFIRGSRPLAMLVNNAGFVLMAPVAKMDADRAEEQVRLHLIALVRLTRATLPGMIAAGHGDVIAVSSTMAFLGRPLIASYSATKAFMITFTESLYEELRDTGVRAQVVCAGRVRTEILERAGVDTTKMPDSTFMSPADVVTASLAGLELGEVVCIPGLEDRGLLDASRALARRLQDESSFTNVLASRYMRAS